MPSTRECWKLCSCPLKTALTPARLNRGTMCLIRDFEFECCGPAQKGGWCVKGMRHGLGAPPSPAAAAGKDASRNEAWFLCSKNLSPKSVERRDVSTQTNSTSAP